MVKSGQAAEAVEVLQAAVVIDPRRTSTWTPLAEAYALAGRREDARAALWVSFQWSGNRDKSLAFYQDRMARETRPQLQALYAHMVGVAQEQMASPK
jgi:predicted Zn-dependent protease